MSRRKLKAREKKTQKMSRDGVVEINAVTGGMESISKREADFDIRGDKPKRETLSQVGTRLDGKPSNTKKTSHRYSEPLRETTNPQQQNAPSRQTDTKKSDTSTVTGQKNTDPPHSASEPPKNPANNGGAVRETQTIQQRYSAPFSPSNENSEKHQTAAAPSVNPRYPPNQTDGASNLQPHKNKNENKAVFEDNSVKSVYTAQSDRPNGTGKLKIRSNDAYHQERHSNAIRQDSDFSLLKHQSEKLTYSEDKTERPAASKQNGVKNTNKRKKSKYRQKQSSAIQHEPQKSDLPLTHGKELTPSAAATVIQTNNAKNFKTQKETVLRHNPPELKTDSHPLPFETPETAQTERNQTGDTADIPHDVIQNQLAAPPDNSHRPAIRQGKKGKSKQNRDTVYRHNKPAVLQNEPQKPYSPLTHGKELTPSAAATVIQADSESKFKMQKETVLRYNQAELKTDSHPLLFETPETEQSESGQTSDTADISRDVTQNRPTAPSDNSRPVRQVRKGKFKQNRDTVYRHNKPTVLQNEPQKSDTPLAHKPETAQREIAKSADISQTTAETKDNSVAQPQSSERDASDKNETDNFETEQLSAGDTLTETKPINDDNPDSSIKHDKSGKLKFSEDEAAPDKKPNRKLEKAERQAEQAGKRLEKAQNKLPAKRKLRTERVFDEQKGKAQRKLHFEKEVKPQGQHLKGTLPLRPVKAGANTLILKAHSKIYQAEHENVAVKAAHRVEMIGESGVRSALYHHKTAPYRKVAKLEKQATKKTIRLNYQKALANNPKLKSNMLSRMWQKRKIKKDYAKAARETKKSAYRAKKAGSYTIRAAKAITQAVYKNPKVIIVIAVLFLLAVIFMSLFSLGANIGNGGLTAILSSSYLAGDADIEQAELSYSEWETNLQFQIFNAESDNPGYHEYRYDIGEISHNPYELMAYLTVVYQNFSYDAILSDLQALFSEQYTLTLTPSTETRYADPTDANDDDDYEPYDWNVLTVKLTARSFSDVILSKMTAEQQIHYALLMQTKGNRQYAGNPFDVGWLPYVTSYYGYRVHPITGAKDLHRGIDIALPAGTEIRSTQDGTVTFAGYSGGYGNVVVIENANGITTKYAHCDTISVSAGQTISAGDVIATVGNTGDSTGAHLHYELLKDGEYLNPLYFTDNGTFNLSPTYGTTSTPMGDGSFAALLAEAEKYLGYPYVWGGSSPSTSFDCSGYVSYILRASGVKDVGRQTAMGLYNLSTPVSPSEAKPGDLVFFHSTFSTPNPISHVGLYIGVIDGHPTMIHAGSVISYAQLDTAYWQNHFYTYARLN